MLNDLHVELTHVFLAIPANETAVDLYVSSAAITSVFVLSLCFFFHTERCWQHLLQIGRVLTEKHFQLCTVDLEHHGFELLRPTYLRIFVDKYTAEL